MKKLLLLLLSAILFTSCSEPEDVNKYKGCVVMKKIPAALNGGRQEERVENSRLEQTYKI